jgi:predicted ATP-dependent serine protease
MQLEHLVDSVFVLKQHPMDNELRVLQCSKNRYGPCQDTILRVRIDGVFESNAVNLHGISSDLA